MNINKTGFTMLSFAAVLLILLVLALKIPFATHRSKDNQQGTTTDSIVDTHPASGDARLAFGETAVFKDLTIRPISLVEDSRCASGVTCIWAGRVVVNLEFVSLGRTETLPLALGESITTESKRITFLSAEPYPEAKKPIAEADYRFVFSVESHDPSMVKQCYTGGCSGEICSDQKNAASNCIYREEFACYKSASCELQSNGACGWTSTPALSMCIANANH